MLKSNELQNALNKRLLEHRLFYVCRDAERAVPGLSLKNFFIITNKTDYSVALAKKNKNIILIKNVKQLDTNELLTNKITTKKIKSGDFVLVFKNTPQIEKICANNNWALLNPNAALSSKIEEKLSQIKWLGDLLRYLPEHKIELCKNLVWNNEPYIVQFNRSHTGAGTILITSQEQTDNLATKFPQREARVSKFIQGASFTNNNIIWEDKIFISNVSYQITGLPPFTENKFATIGNDWALPCKLLSAKQQDEYKQIAIDVGQKMRDSGWRGLFGIDIIIEEKTNKLFLIEVNARQPASSSFESILQNTVITQEKETTVFFAHLASLLNIKEDNYTLANIKKGAQIIQRVTGKITKVKLKKIKDITAISYQNDQIDSDLLRLQSFENFMDDHNIFNKTGKNIIKNLSIT